MRRIWTIVTVALLASLSPTAPAHAGLEMYAIHSDHLGTPRVITDKDQRVVWRGNPRPFGSMEVEVEEITHHQRFPGQRFDIESGRHYNYFRDYDPSLGRYIQPDPIGLQGGMNSYVYVDDNPLTYLDPFGLCKAVGRTSTGQTILDCNQDGDDWPYPDTYCPSGECAAFDPDWEATNCVSKCAALNLLGGELASRGIESAANQVSRRTSNMVLKSTAEFVAKRASPLGAAYTLLTFDQMMNQCLAQCNHNDGKECSL